MPNIDVKLIHDNYNLGDAEVGDYFVGQKSDDDTVTGTLNFAPKVEMDPAPQLSADLDLNGNDILGDLRVQNYNSGTNASSSTYLRGDATWENPVAASAATNGVVNAGTTGQFAYYAADGNTVSGISDVPLATISGLGTGVETFLATPSSANLASALTDETGSGSAVFATAPQFPTKITVGGNATAAGLIELLEDTDNGSNKITLTAPQSIASDKTITLQDVTGTVYVSGGTDVAIADGGTGVSSVTTSPTASAFAGWDANSNLSANNFLKGFLSSTSATVTLTNASPQFIQLADVSAQTLKLPDIATIPNGASWTIYNVGSNVATIQLSDGSALTTLAFTKLLTATYNGTSWILQYSSRGLDYSSTIVLTGSAVSMTSSVAANITSISLPAGNYIVWGEMWTKPAGTTTTSLVTASINTTSATQPSAPSDSSCINSLRGISASAGLVIPITSGMTRLGLSVTTTVYLIGVITFAVSTMEAYGAIKAIKINNN